MRAGAGAPSLRIVGAAPAESIRSFEDALDAVGLTLDGAQAHRKHVERRVRLIRRQLASGRLLSEIVVDEEQPLIVRIMRDASSEMVDAFSRLQRAEAQLLHAEGISMERIGRLFGISRQRVAELVRPSTKP